jgi:hypothetical protein
MLVFCGILKAEKNNGDDKYIIHKDNSIKYPVMNFIDAASGFNPSGFAI